MPRALPLVLWLIANAAAAADAPALERALAWSWDPARVGTEGYVRSAPAAFTCRRISSPGADTWDQQGRLEIREGAVVVFAETLRGDLPFVIVGRSIVVARYDPIVSGCALEAISLDTRRVLWSAPLRGIGPIGHSKYRNEVAIEHAPALGAVVVRGREAAGRYVEVVGLATGATLGHRLHPTSARDTRGMPIDEPAAR